MVAVQTKGNVGAFGQTLADRLNTEELGGSYMVEIQKLDRVGSGPLIEAGHLPADADAILVTLKKPITGEATLRFIKIISQEFCRWTIEKEDVTQRRRALVIREEGAERKLRTILFDDVGE
jgi:hypothetical protein